MANLFMRFPKGLKKTITLSYDDGVTADLKLIEILNKHGLKGTFNTNCAMFGQGKRLSENDFISAVKNGGHEAAIHGYTHPFLEQLSPIEATLEIIKDREALEKATGEIIRGMAYPYGTFNDTVVEILKNCGIAYSRTVVSTENFDIPTDWLRMPATCHHNNKRLNELCKNFLENSSEERAPLLFYLWGHSYEFDNNNNWNVIEEFCEKMGGRDDIWYATNIEIYDYIQAYNSLIFSLGMKKCKNPTATDVYFRWNKADYCVKGGEEIIL